MGISKYPSCVTLPGAAQPYPALLDFLSLRFPNIERAVWAERLRTGKILDEAGEAIDSATPYRPRQKLYYFREVAAEVPIPLAEKILFHNDQLLVVDKPPFLPVTPSGRYVDECLLNRLKATTGNPNLVPLHRIDRETAGLVLFSQRQETRGRYAALFLDGRIEKSYAAVAELGQRPQTNEWTLESRLVEGQPWFRMQQVAGAVNARSRIRLLTCRGTRGLFELEPITGKKHQLRVHMSGLGFPILNDRYYPELLPEQADNLEQPLQLLAQRLGFIDPLSGRRMEFASERRLLF